NPFNYSSKKKLKIFPLYKRKKDHTWSYLLYQLGIINMCVNTYFDTICVHPLKSAYSLPQLRTIKLTNKLEFDCKIINVFYSCDSFSTDRFYQKHPSNASHTIPMKQRQDHKQKT